jgi:RNA polymerase sigma-70 factor, ECF subfamily
VERVARLFAGLGRQMAEVGARLERRTINGQPAAIVRDPEGAVVCVWVVDVAAGRVGAVRSVINPEKLGHLGRVANVRALTAARGRT